MCCSHKIFFYKFGFQICLYSLDSVSEYVFFEFIDHAVREIRTRKNLIIS